MVDRCFHGFSFDDQFVIGADDPIDGSGDSETRFGGGAERDRITFVKIPHRTLHSNLGTTFLGMQDAHQVDFLDNLLVDGLTIVTDGNGCRLVHLLDIQGVVGF